MVNVKNRQSIKKIVIKFYDEIFLNHNVFTTLSSNSECASETEIEKSESHSSTLFRVARE